MILMFLSGNNKNNMADFLDAQLNSRHRARVQVQDGLDSF